MSLEWICPEGNFKTEKEYIDAFYKVQKDGLEGGKLYHLMPYSFYKEVDK